MASYDPSSISRLPELSIIIAVYNDWGPLDQCLRSLEQQTNPPDFEVIVVDDGSEKAPPEAIRLWSGRYPLMVVRQAHAGISAARNRGLQDCRGSILVFTDADCRFRADCLSALVTATAAWPHHNSFQLHLAGERSGIAGRAEDLRLIALQQYALQPDGRIRYLNTAGFAIRRAHVKIETGLFNPAALRAEDTLLLAELIQRKDLPFFVADATVEHVVALSFRECLLKDVRSAWQEGKTFEIIRAQGVRVRMSQRDRFSMLLSTWRTSRQSSIGRRAWFVLIARQLLQRTVTFGYRCLGPRDSSRAPENAS